MIEIDGSTGSGGGQTLRTAISLSVITRKPCYVFRIRHGRPNPGLAPQHLLGIRALNQLCNGRLEGDSLGSEEIKFYPGEISRYQTPVNIKIPTAGSITLVLQSLIPPALFAPGPIKITFDGGATDTFFSPSLDHFRYVFLKILEKMGAKIEIDILRRGYYPEGGAKVEIKIFPAKVDTCYQANRRINTYNLRPINLIERGALKKILVISGASNYLKEKKVAERQIAGVKEVLGKLKLPIEEKIEYYDTRSPGSQICLIAEFENTIIGTDNLGKLGKPSEMVGRECALELLREEKSGGCLDKFLTDQILIYMALSKGKSQAKISKLTSHAKTNIWVIQQFLPGRFEVRDNLIKWVPSK